MNKERALFVDRDGVICRMVMYGGKWDSVQRIEDVKLVEGIVEIIAWANKNNVLTVEISNQPGVAKGKMSREFSDAIETRVHQLLGNKGARVDHKYICMHHPRGVVAELTGECECRKPKPGLLVQAAQNLDIDMEKSLFLGDKASDVAAGRAAGVKTILYLHEDDDRQKVEETRICEYEFGSDSMNEVSEFVKMYFGG